MPPDASYDELRALDPELDAIEAAARAVRDPGGDLFCANHAWFSIMERLKARLGVWRRAPEGEAPEAAAKLGSASAFEAAFKALYPLLPPCRACGCVLFEKHREEDLAAREAARGARQTGRAVAPARPEE